jgi:hypothetical protein
MLVANVSRLADLTDQLTAWLAIPQPWPKMKTLLIIDLIQAG